MLKPSEKKEGWGLSLPSPPLPRLGAHNLGFFFFVGGAQHLVCFPSLWVGTQKLVFFSYLQVGAQNLDLFLFFAGGGAIWSFFLLFFPPFYFFPPLFILFLPFSTFSRLAPLSFRRPHP